MEILSDLIAKKVDTLAHVSGQRYLKIDSVGKVIGTTNVEETDPTVPSHVKAITSGQTNQWNQAFGWGNHASAGYVTLSGNQTITSEKTFSNRRGLISRYGITSAPIYNTLVTKSIYGIFGSLDPAVNNTFGDLFGIGYSYSTLGGAYYSNSHNIVFTSAGNVQATIGINGGHAHFLGNARFNSFIKHNGTSSEFLKADGSVDSTAYQPAGSYGLTTADITAVGLTTSTLTLTRAAGNLTASVPTWNQNTTGSAATLTTARTLTIGSTGKTFNGSANVSWSLAEIGAIGGTITSGQVAFGSSSNTILGSDGFIWDNTNRLLQIERFVDGLQTGATRYRKSRGTVSSPLDVNSGDYVGAFIFEGRVAGSYTTDRSGIYAGMTSTTGISVGIVAGTTNSNFNPTLIVHHTQAVGINLGNFVTAPTNTLDVNGTARIRTLSNATGNFVTTSATGVLQQRTAAEVLTDIGAQPAGNYQSVTSISTTLNSTYVGVAQIVAPAGLSSKIHLTIRGTANAVVINYTATILVNHSGDILVESKSGFYTPVTIRITSNTGGDYYLEVKTSSANSAPSTIIITPLNGETIIANPSSNPYSSNVYEHTAEFGLHVNGYDSGTTNTSNARITAPAFKKVGGTSNQFLKADGSVDSSTYGLSSADITAVGLTASTLTLTRAAGNLTASVPTWNQNTTGSAATLTTPRTLTIGSTGKTFNGSANVSWSLAEIGAAASAHTHTWSQITDAPTKISLAELNTGTANTDRLVDAKNLNDWLTGKLSNSNGYTEELFTFSTVSTFTLAQGNPMAISVFHNGQRLAPTLDYTVTGNQVAVTALLNAGDEILITYFFSIAGVFLSGSGTSGSVPLWSSATGLTNSILTQSGSVLTAAGQITATQFNGALNGNASTAATLQTARTINGTSFNGSVNITTASWGTARTITIGSTGKPVNGSENVSWTLAEIGAEAALVAGTSAQYYRGDKTWQTLNTTAVAEGTNLYYTDARVRSAVLTGLGAGSNTAITATDSLLAALANLQNQINNRAASSHGHAASAITAGTFGTGGYVFPGILGITGQSYQVAIINKGNSGTGTVTFNWNDGNIQLVTLTGNCTFAFSNPQVSSYQIKIVQDGTGSRSITWPTGIHWSGKTVPTLTGTPNSVDWVTITYDGSVYSAVISKNHGV